MILPHKVNELLTLSELIHCRIIKKRQIFFKTETQKLNMVKNEVDLFWHLKDKLLTTILEVHILIDFLFLFLFCFCFCFVAVQDNILYVLFLKNVTLPKI